MDMKFGYARVSTHDQSLDRQIDALKKAGCKDKSIFTDKMSGTKSKRPGLDALLAQLRENDTVIITKLDRLGRSLRDIINLVNEFQERGVRFVSLHDNIDTSTPSGKFYFHVFAALAEFERDLISDRTKSGLETARKKGRVGGRPKGLSKKAQDKARLAESLYREQERSIKEICNHLEISKPTLYRYLRSRGIKFSK